MTLAATNPDADHFEFGRNWRKFLGQFDEDRLLKAEQSIRGFTGLDDLRGLTFLDIGCGSGLFSWAALRLGAARVVSMDLDEDSVACARYLHDKAGRPENWTITQGSVLDAKFIADLGRFDIVYSWGVLHHTGRMWDAIGAAMSAVAESGWLYIAIYNRVGGLRGSRYWRGKKRLYNALPTFGRRLIEWTHVAYFAQSKILRGKSPMRSIREYRSNRGMDWYTNLVDWLGGYPYEYATVDELFHFVHRRDRTFALVNVNAAKGLGCNSLLFKRFPQPAGGAAADASSR